MKIEVGDRVRLVRSGYSFEGSEGIVKEVDLNGNPTALTEMDDENVISEPEGGWTLDHDHDEVELVQKGEDESEDKHPFDVGDMVKVHKPDDVNSPHFWNPDMDPYDGYVSTIGSFLDTKPSVVMLEGVREWAFHVNWLEHYSSEDEKDQEYKFKKLVSEPKESQPENEEVIEVGDVVEIATSNDGSMDDDGRTFTVKKIGCHWRGVNWYYHDLPEADFGSEYYYADELKLVSKHKEDPGQHKDRFSVGQKVRVVNKGKGGTAHYLGTGDAGTVTEVCSNDDVRVRTRTDHQYVPAVELEIVDEAADVPDKSTVNSPGFDYHFPRKSGMTCVQRISGLSLAMDAPTLNEFSSDDSKLDKKGGLMSALRSIPTRLKRLLNANFKAFYQLQWVDEDMELTPEGKKELIDVLFDEYESKLGERAKSEVDRIQKEEKQKGCK